MAGSNATGAFSPSNYAYLRAPHAFIPEETDQVFFALDLSFQLLPKSSVLG
jgi:hypothetical protein